jgi:glycosyltransferase involved in cell wall biosynthesis
MNICLVGGIFGKPEEYRRAVSQTPETVLAAGLRARGHAVYEQAHAPNLALEGFDVVHVHHLALGAVAAAARAPQRLVFTPHWLRHRDRTRRAAARYVAGRANAVVALSETEARWQREHFFGVDQRQHVIPNGVDRELFAYVEPRPPGRGEPWKLLYVGQLVPFKGVSFLLRAVARLAAELPVELNLCYQVDHEEQALRGEAEELGLTSVHFLGSRSTSEVASLYADSHALVLPSTGEALPSVITEAMLVGRPVIATDVGGVREQVGDFGVVVAPRDPDALASAISQTLATYERFVMAAPDTSRRTAKRYSISAMVDAHEQMYTQLLEAPLTARSRTQRAADRGVGMLLRLRRDSPPPPRNSPIRVARIIGRLNVGSPAVQAIHLTRELPRYGFDTRLLRGSESPDEGSMDSLAADLGICSVTIPSMRREVGPGDLSALLQLVGELRRYRPHIVHTEAAKAGALGRAATMLAFPLHRPAIVHTFHGHSLEGYFHPHWARIFLAIERFLARYTSVLIAVSDEVKHDLVRLGVSDPQQIRVVHIGLDLVQFQAIGPERESRRQAMRSRWQVSAQSRVVTLVARLVPIKRVDRFLRVANLVARSDPEVTFVIVGDGELRDQLQNSVPAQELGERLRWVGFEKDMPSVYFASDCVVLTSDNEGTPASLIEAHAAGVPVVTTRVGGTPSVVRDGVSGRLIASDDEERFADAVLEALTAGPELGDAGRAHVLSRYGLGTLLGELSSLYRAIASAERTEDQTTRHSASSATDMGPAR